MAQFVDAQLPDVDLPRVTIDLDEAHGVGIGLVAADMECAAGITRHGRRIADLFLQGVVGMTDGLRLVDVAQCQVVVTLSQGNDVLGGDFADLEAVAGGIGAGDSQMPHHDDGETCGVLLVYIIEEALEQFPAFAYHVGQGNDVARGELDDVVVLPSVGTLEQLIGWSHADEGGVGVFPDCVVGLQTGCAVVVACHDDDVHGGTCLVELHEVFGEGLLDGG